MGRDIQLLRSEAELSFHLYCVGLAATGSDIWEIACGSGRWESFCMGTQRIGACWVVCIAEGLPATMCTCEDYSHKFLLLPFVQSFLSLFIVLILAPARAMACGVT